MSEPKRIPQHVAIIMDGTAGGPGCTARSVTKAMPRVWNPCGLRCALPYAGG